MIVIRNNHSHKFLLKAVFPLLLHDRFLIAGQEVGRAVVCISFDCESNDDMNRVPSLLATLDENKVTTSFAVRGDLAREHPQIIKDILKSNHEIVNHSFSHPPNFRSLGADQMRSEIESFQQHMTDNFHYKPVGFRAPHLMRRYNSDFFRILADNQLYDSSHVGMGIAQIDGVPEIPLTSCPDHTLVCFDYWHHFEIPLLRASLDGFLRVWERLFRTTRLVNVYLDPKFASDVIIGEMVKRVPKEYAFLRMQDILELARAEINRPGK
jgi:peptidoglycan/xylan/chitin deacetylase (PgdA/CDA1 family)